MELAAAGADLHGTCVTCSAASAFPRGCGTVATCGSRWECVPHHFVECAFALISTKIGPSLRYRQHGGGQAPEHQLRHRAEWAELSPGGSASGVSTITAGLSAKPCPRQEWISSRAVLRSASHHRSNTVKTLLMGWEARTRDRARRRRCRLTPELCSIAFGAWARIARPRLCTGGVRPVCGGIVAAAEAIKVGVPPTGTVMGPVVSRLRGTPSRAHQVGSR